MTIPQYANGRSQLPAPVVSKEAGGNFTAAVAGTYYFALQGQNRCGRTKLSSISSVVVEAGDRLLIQIPSTARASAEDWLFFIISASQSSDPTTFQQIGYYKGYEANQITPTPLPATITLEEDAHLGLGAIVSSPGSLPSDESLLAGMIRGVSSLTYYYVYDPDSTADVDDVNHTVLTASPGRWLRGGVPDTYVADVTDTGGCAIDIRDLGDAEIIFPDYAVSKTSRTVGTPVRLWLVNDSSDPIAAGVRVGLTIQFNEMEKTKAFNGLLKIKFVGYANPVTGELDKTSSTTGNMIGVDEIYDFQAKKANFILQKDLPAGQAYALEVYPEFAGFELEEELPVSAGIRVLPFFYMQSGEFCEAGLALGEDWIYPILDKRRIVPDLGLGAIALPGGYMVDSFSIQKVGTTYVSGLAANTNHQKICINGIGATWVEPGDVKESAALRAIVGTVNGTGRASSPSAYLTIGANSTITVTVPYPCDEDGYGTIRTDYPDRIAGNNQGLFNPDTVTLYIQDQATGHIRRFEGYPVVPGTSQQFVVTSWTDGVDIGLYTPSVANTFGLFVPDTPTLSISGGGVFPAGTYRVYAAFAWVDAITRISHREIDGCLFEPDSTLVEVFERVKYWGQGVLDLSALRSIPLASVSAFQVRPVVAPPRFYQFNPLSVEVDDGSSDTRVVKPSEIPSDQPGRWISYNEVIEIGTVETGFEGQPASVTVINPTVGAQQLNFVLPRGERGAPGRPNTLAIGTVRAGWNSDDYAATITGTAPNQFLNLVLPPGRRGERGERGLKGDKGDTGNPMNPVDLIGYLQFFG
ncbi:MAG TPA: hypothetical protein V6C65_04480 [Allocoleopsis sp.]